MSSFNRLHLIRQVDFFTLRLFLSAVEEQQIGRAAIRENIAASTATKRIQDLEDIAGVKLLERTPKGVVPSLAGEVVVRYIRTIFGNLDDMRAELAAVTEGTRGEVTVASARTIIVPFLARELAAYAHDFPLVELAVQELENAEIAQAVAKGTADIGVFAAAPGLDLGGLKIAPYRKDRMVAVLPRGHVLAERASVNFEDLLGENLIVSGAMLSAFRAAAKRLDREFKPKYSVTSAGVAIGLAGSGLGVTVQPECLVGLAFFDQVVTIDLDEPWAIRAIHIATSSERLPSPATTALLTQLLARPQSAEPAQDPNSAASP